jgi:hypothetical protein
MASRLMRRVLADAARATGRDAGRTRNDCLFYWKKLEPAIRLELMTC